MPSAPSDRARLCGIDPGTDTLGISIFEVNVCSWEIYSCTAFTVVGSHLPLNPQFCATHGPRFARIQAHKTNLLEIFNFYQPSWVVCESPFYSARQPQAFGALTEIVTAIREAVCQYDVSLPLLLVDPPSAKKAVGAPGNAKKEPMLSAVCALPQLNYTGPVPLHLLDEHSIDAIAIGYWKLLQFKQG